MRIPTSTHRRAVTFPHRPMMAIAAAAVLALTVSLLTPQEPAFAASGAVGGFPDAPTAPRVEGSLAGAEKTPRQPKIDKATITKPVASQRKTLTLSDQGGTAELGDTGITFESADGKRGSAAARSSMQVEVLDASKRLTLGGVDFALEITPSSSDINDVRVTIPDDALAGLGGGDRASRIKWVTVPSEKRWVTASRATAADASRDADSSTVTVSTRKPVIIMAASSTVSASGTGSYSATSLKPSSSWNVSAQTGAFSWSYPIPMPPAPAGATPSFSLDYNSQLVDGATASTNNQPSAVGEGWTLSGTGFIERRYVPCAQE
jgi:hypothetical protein